MMEKTCERCGNRYVGGNASKYCPECRAVKQKEFARKAALKYRKNHYDKILVTIPAGDREGMKTAAEKQGESLNAYIVEAVRRRMEAEQ